MEEKLASGKVGLLHFTAIEYSDLIIQFGYIVLFGIFFPLAPVIAIVQNVIKIQVDKQRVIKYYKRPLNEDANSIGIWDVFLQALLFLAVIINTGTICFKTHTIDTIYLQILNISRFSAFLLLALCVFFLLLFFKFFLPTVPSNISLVQKRHNHIVEAKITGVRNQENICIGRNRIHYGITCTQGQFVDRKFRISSRFKTKDFHKNVEEEKKEQ
jgi:hypothetical protein